MAKAEIVEPVIRLCAVISRHKATRQRAVAQLTASWGKPLRISDELPFEAGGFYQRSMGDNLVKQLVAFTGLVDPAELARWKLQTNQWESEEAQQHRAPEPRPLNLDPGYVSQAKLVLATTKDRDHRIYLREGIFAEVTLNYMRKAWVHHRWTYPDYRTTEVAEFLTTCREYLREQLRQANLFRQRIESSGGSDAAG